MNASSDSAKPPLDALIGRLSALHQKRIDLGLERMHRLLERLGHPERKLPPVIHVAGTNGKGSTVAYLRATLEAAGLRVHAYTSPYLVRINECFRLGRVGGGVLVSDDELRAALEEVERVNAGEPATVFELKTAAAFHLFAQNPADAVLLEVGLGGRLDSTNVVDTPAACVITPVSMDHMEFLGPTLASIAGEKAAIIKRGVPVVCAEQTPEAMAVIEAQAKLMRAPLFAANESWHVNVEHGRLVYSDERGLMDLRRRACSAAISSTMPALRSQRCGRSRLSRSTRRHSRPASSVLNGRRGCSVSPRASCSPGVRKAARSGSTAGTMPKAAASRPLRSAISRSGCRGRWL